MLTNEVKKVREKWEKAPDPHENYTTTKRKKPRK